MADDPVQRILDRVERHVRSGAGWKAICPAHDDRSPSLSINRGDNGNALVNCQVGCGTDEVMTALGLRMADLFVDGRDRPRDEWRVARRPVGAHRPPLAAVPAPEGRAKAPAPPLGPVVASYDYRDASGAVLFTKTRHEPKTFRVRRPGGAWGIGDAARVLYRLPEVLAAVRAGEPVWITEGEKDADRLAAMGVAATCNFDGAAKPGSRAKWQPEYGDQLAGAHVVIVRDLDDAGAGHALTAFDDLTGKAASVRIVEPATGGQHDDVSDHLDAGRTLDELVAVDPMALRATLAPRTAPRAVEITDDQLNALTFANLPEEFWSARPVLAHIRQAAHARNRSADVLLFSTLARLAAMRSHLLTADTGVGALASLNLLVALVGRSGAGKSSGISTGKRLIPVPGGLDFLDGAPLGSGEGMAEAFMGTREVETVGRTGKPRVDKVRQQVRHNALLFLDEGQTLTKMLERAGTTVGPTLRSAFGGETLGQLNATSERTRLVTDYSLGVVIGFQPSTVIPLLDDAEAGTPQRFIYASATDPSIPAHRVPDPGPLRVSMAPLMAREATSIEFVEPVKDAIYAADHANATGQTAPPLLDSHEALSRVKVAALLALLDGRRDVNEEDWALALVVWRTSCAVRNRLVSEAQGRVARREWARRQAYVDDQVEATAAVEDRQVERVARWAAERLHGGGEPMKPYVLRKSAAGRDKPVFEVAVDYAVSQRWVRRGADGVLSAGPSRPAEDGR